MREWKMRYGQNSKGGKCRSKPYGTPTRDYIEKACSYVVRLVLILLTEESVLVIAVKIVAAFVVAYWYVRRRLYATDAHSVNLVRELNCTTAQTVSPYTAWMCTPARYS